MSLFINGRFRSAEITGVQRYATEVIKSMKIEKSLLEPSKSLPLQGHIWEQIILPSLVPKDGLLWCPANTGPMFMKNQVVTIHDASVLSNPEWFTKNFARFYTYMWGNIVRNSRFIITDSSFSRDSLVEFYPFAKKKIINIPLGVDPIFSAQNNKVVREVMEKYSLREDYILSLGSIESRKNLKSLFIAWESWLDKPRNLTLVVAGGHGKNFSSIGFEKIPEGVKITGRIDEKDLPGLYGGAFTFVFPSLYEGFGLPPLEAMAAGVPVICSNAASLPEVVGNACLYIDPKKPSTILDALKCLVANPQMRVELSAAGKERAKLFTWQKTAELTAQVIQKAMI